jgi:hypothetical protein
VEIRKIQGSGRVQKNSRFRWSSEKFKVQVEFRKIQGSGGVQKNSRLRWSSEKFKDQKNSRIRWKSEKFKAQVDQTVPPSAIIPNNSSFCHHPKQFLLPPSPQTVPPSAITPNSSSFCHHPKQLLLLPSPQTVPPSKAIFPNNLSLLTPGRNIALLMHIPSLKVHILSDSRTSRLFLRG